MPRFANRMQQDASRQRTAPAALLRSMMQKPMDKRRIGNWLGIVAALAAGLALRVWFIVHVARIAGDSLIYGEIAKNWLQHGIYGFVVTHGVPQPTLIRLPGYPLFLMGCFRIFGVDAYTSVMYVQSMIDLGTCLLAGALAYRLFGRRAGMAALWMAALCPFTACYTATALTETLTLACIATVFYAFDRWTATDRSFNRWLWLIVAALSYSILLRPEQGLLAAVVIPAMLWLAVHSHRKSWRQAILPVLTAAVCVLLPLIPWAARNWHTFHVIQPLAPRYATDPGEHIPLGFQRWYRTWAIDFASTENVYWNYDDGPIEITDLPTRAFDSDEQYERTSALLNAYNIRANATPIFDAQFAAIARERIATDPLRYYVALPVARLVNMTLRPRAEMFPIALEWWKWHEHRAQTAVAASFAALNLVYLVFAGIGIVMWRRRQGTEQTALAAAMLASILLRAVLLLTLDNSEPRYTLEFFPILFVLGSIVFARRDELSDSLRSSSHSS
jgi:4-amino-4-deoxy-L-arabinose transferase-like glycosyltransferase